MSDPDFSPPVKIFVTPKHRKKRKSSLSEDLESPKQDDKKNEQNQKKFNFQKRRKNLTGYKCSQCNRSFNSKSEVNKHAKNVHSESTILICPYCGEPISRKDNLIRHIQDVHNSSNALLYCEQTDCGKSFASKRALQRHIDDNHEKKKFKCTVCKTDFSRRNLLERHMVAVHVAAVQDVPLTFRCECGKDFRNSQGLMSHRKYCGESLKIKKRSEYTLKQKRAAVRIIEGSGIDKTPTKLPLNVRNLVSEKTKLSPRAARRAFRSRKRLFEKKKTFAQKADDLDALDSIDKKDKKLFGSVKAKNLRKRTGRFKRLPGGGRKQDDWWVKIKRELRKEFLILREDLLAEVNTTILLECVYKIAGELNINLNEVLADTSDPRKSLYKRLLNFLNEYNLARKKSNQQSHISPHEQGLRAGAMIRECRMLRENLGISDMECFDELRIYVCEMCGKGAETIHFVGAKDTFTTKYSNPKVSFYNFKFREVQFG